MTVAYSPHVRPICVSASGSDAEKPRSTALLIRWSMVRVHHGSFEQSPIRAGLSDLVGEIAARGFEGDIGPKVNRRYTSGPKTLRKPSGNGLFGLVRYRLQVGCLVSPADLVALGPKHHLRSPGALGSDFQAKVLARAKELLGNTEAEARMEAGLQD